MTIQYQAKKASGINTFPYILAELEQISKLRLITLHDVTRQFSIGIEIEKKMNLFDDWICV